MVIIEQGGNGVTPSAAHCAHIAFGHCGECAKPSTPDQKKIAELEEKLAAMERFLNVRHQPEAAVPAKPIRLDLGCGTASRRLEMKNWTREQGWTGVDIQPSDGADVVCDLSSGRWPWEDNSVDEVNCHHMLEHIAGAFAEWFNEFAPIAAGDVEYVPSNLPGRKAVLAYRPLYPRAHFFNELWRVLKPGGKGSFVTPYWGSCRAYGDVTHEWPPIGEMSYLYLDKEWRKSQAPHDNFYACDFTHGLGYAPGSHLVGRTPEFVQEAIRDHKEGAGDLLATLVCRK